LAIVHYFELMTDSLPPVAVLLREARSAYGAAIRRELAARGFDALPPNGAFVLAALHYDMTREDIVLERGRAMENSQTIEKLIEAGYITQDEGGLHLTNTGHDCAHGVNDATSALTIQVGEAMGEEGYRHFIAGLITLIEFKEAAEES
jgi:hypothetical protein